MDIIDIHPHVIATDEQRYPFNPVGGKMSVWAKERPVDCDGMLAWMDKAGIGRSVIVHASTAYGYDNSYAADCAQAHPDRFRFVGAVDVTAPDAPEKLRYWVRERGMIGFRIFAAGSTMGADSGDWLDDPKTYPAWEAARELGISIVVQTRFKTFPALRKLLERFGDVKVIIDHFSHPPAGDGPPYTAAQPFFDLATFPNVYLKLTERVFHDLDNGVASTPTFMEKTIAAFGVNRIAWGSNFPSSDGTLVELVDRAKRELAFLPEADRAQIFSGTALRIYPSLATI